MARVVVTSPADADADRIIADLGAKAGERVADRYGADFDELYERLAKYPESGAPRPGLGPDVRICVIAPYVVVYEHIKAADTVTILRILHGRRDVTRRLLRQ